MPNLNSIVSINIVILNGEKYIHHCLNSVLTQSYSPKLIEINILDNGSTDGTVGFIENWKMKNENFKITFKKSNFNYGMWGGQEELLKQSSGKYIVILSVDVILEKDFITNAVHALDTDSGLGAIQAKVYQFDIQKLETGNCHKDLPKGEKLETGVIDTCGFKVFRSRRVINVGHGEVNTGQYGKACEIFGVEGAVPVFRKEALESIRVLGEITDHDLFWYGEDLDVAWRLRLAGWRQCYEPSVVAWHDRQTTKQTRRGLRDFIAIRRAIPLRKRQLEWRNIRCTIIKNDYIINILKDLLPILSREIAMTVYLLIFETAVFAELPTLLKLIPRMLRKRQEIMKRAKVGPTEINAYFS